MEPLKEPGQIRPLSRYLKDVLRFYNLKNERVAQVVFVIVLLVNLAGIFAPDVQPANIVFSLVNVTIIYLVLAVYTVAYIKDLKGEEYGIKGGFSHVGKNAVKILAVSVGYIMTIAYAFGVVFMPKITEYMVIFLIIPVMVIYMIFIFSICYILDRNNSITGALKASRNITNGRKGKIFITLLLLGFVFGIPATVILMMSGLSDNILIYTFVLSFIMTISSLMQQRLIVLMYTDLEYGLNDKEKDGIE